MERIIHTKLVKMGTKFQCVAPMFLTETNQNLNKKVHKTCKQRPKFKPRIDCRGCEYLEIKTDE